MKSNDWLADLPADWHALRLKRAVQLSGQRDTEPDPDAFYVGMENIESWTGRLLKNDAPLSDSEEEPEGKSTSNRFATGNVLFGKLRPYLAKVWLADRPGICSTELLVLESGERVHAGFLAHALRTREFIDAVDGTTFGARMPRADWGSIGDIPIPLPSLERQRAIADHLDRETRRIDELIAAKERWLDLLAEKRTAAAEQIVTRGVDSGVSLKPSGIEWLPRIPRHWEVKKVAYLFQDRDERGSPDLPLLEVSIQSGVSVREFSDEHIETMAADFNTYKVARAGDIAFNKMRMWQGAVGAVPEDGLISPDYTVARPTGELLADYAAVLFRSPIFSAECARHSNGIVWDRLRLYWDGFRDIRLPLPPLPEQRAIVAHIRAETAKLDALRAATERSLALLRERRAALVAEAVTGRLPLMV